MNDDLPAEYFHGLHITEDELILTPHGQRTEYFRYNKEQWPYGLHRRRIYTEEKAKVVAAG